MNSLTLRSYNSALLSKAGSVILNNVRIARYQEGDTN